MEGANQPATGSGGDEYDYMVDDLHIDIDQDFLLIFSEEYNGSGNPDSAGGSLDQPSFDPFNDGPDVGSVDSSTTVATGSEGSTTKTQERKRKIDISSDDVLAFWELSRSEAASKLKVSESTLKRVCRKYGIHRWPPRGIDKNGGRAMRQPDLGQPSMDAVNNGRSFIGTERGNLDVALSDSIIRQERKKGKTGVKIEIPREVVLQYSDMRLDDAARKLKVCSATLKRICRDYGIHRWPPRNINKDGSPRPLPC